MTEKPYIGIDLPKNAPFKSLQQPSNMAQDNNRFALYATLLAIGLVGGISLLLWAITSRVDRAVQVNQSGSVLSDENVPEALRSRVSAGEEALFDQPSVEKAKGIEAIAQNNYADAITAFNASLAAEPNDPEAFIYRNNARIGDQKARTIAVIVPSEGSEGVSLEMLRGAAQAQYDINRNGGIDGALLKVIIVKDENNLDVAESIAQTLVSDEMILGVVGHYSSDVTARTAPIYAQGQLVTISPVSSAVDLSGLSPYLYRTVPTDSFSAAALAAYMVYYRENRNAAIFFDSTSEASRSLKESFVSFVSAWGGDIVAEYDFSNSGFDDDVLLEAEQDGADTIMIASSLDTLDAAVDIINANEGALPVLGGDELYNRALLADTKSNSQALTISVPWHLLSRDTDAEFVRSSQDLWKGDVSWRTASTYDAVLAIATGLQGDASREGLKAALDSEDFNLDTSSGPLSFLPSGDRRQVDRLVKVEAGTRSGAGYDFIPFTPFE